LHKILSVYSDDNAMVSKNTDVIVKRMPAKRGCGILSRMRNQDSGNAITPSTQAGNTDPRLPEAIVVATNNPSNNGTKTDETADEADGGSGSIYDTVGQTDQSDAEQAALSLVNETAAASRTGSSNKTISNVGGLSRQSASWPGGSSQSTQGGDSQHSIPSKPLLTGVPHPGYICHNCGNPGHYKHECPNLGDPNTEKPTARIVPIIKGIPKTHLREVDSVEGMTGNVVKTSWGGFATMAPQEHRFNDAVRSGGGQSTAESLQAKADVPTHLQCKICRNLMSEAVLIPCCGKSACDGCMRKKLSENNCKCPLCEKDMTPDKILPNEDLRTSIDAYRKDVIKEQKERDEAERSRQIELANQQADKLASQSRRRESSSGPFLLHLDSNEFGDDVYDVKADDDRQEEKGSPEHNQADSPKSELAIKVPEPAENSESTRPEPAQPSQSQSPKGPPPPADPVGPQGQPEAKAIPPIPRPPGNEYLPRPLVGHPPYALGPRPDFGMPRFGPVPPPWDAPRGLFPPPGMPHRPFDLPRGPLGLHFDAPPRGPYGPPRPPVPFDGSPPLGPHMPPHQQNILSRKQFEELQRKKIAERERVNMDHRQGDDHNTPQPSRSHSRERKPDQQSPKHLKSSERKVTLTEKEPMHDAMHSDSGHPYHGTMKRKRSGSYSGHPEDHGDFQPRRPYDHDPSHPQDSHSPHGGQRSQSEEMLQGRFDPHPQRRSRSPPRRYSEEPPPVGWHDGGPPVRREAPSPMRDRSRERREPNHLGPPGRNGPPRRGVPGRGFPGGRGEPHAREGPPPGFREGGRIRGRSPSFRDGPPIRDDQGPPLRDGHHRDFPPQRRGDDRYLRDGPPREGPPRDVLARDVPPRDGPSRNGPPREGPPREGPRRDGRAPRDRMVQERPDMRGEYPRDERRQMPEEPRWRDGPMRDKPDMMRERRPDQRKSPPVRNLGPQRREPPPRDDMSYRRGSPGRRDGRVQQREEVEWRERSRREEQFPQDKLRDEHLSRDRRSAGPPSSERRGNSKDGSTRRGREGEEAPWGRRMEDSGGGRENTQGGNADQRTSRESGQTTRKDIARGEYDDTHLKGKKYAKEERHVDRSRSHSSRRKSRERFPSDPELDRHGPSKQQQRDQTEKQTAPLIADGDVSPEWRSPSRERVFPRDRSNSKDGKDSEDEMEDGEEGEIDEAKLVANSAQKNSDHGFVSTGWDSVGDAHSSGPGFNSPIDNEPPISHFFENEQPSRPREPREPPIYKYIEDSHQEHQREERMPIFRPGQPPPGEYSRSPPRSPPRGRPISPPRDRPMSPPRGRPMRLRSPPRGRPASPLRIDRPPSPPHSRGGPMSPRGRRSHSPRAGRGNYGGRPEPMALRSSSRGRGGPGGRQHHGNLGRKELKRRRSIDQDHSDNFKHQRANTYNQGNPGRGRGRGMKRSSRPQQQQSQRAQRNRQQGQRASQSSKSRNNSSGKKRKSKTQSFDKNTVLAQGLSASR